MSILIACEESQAVTKEFRKLGLEAYSCDIDQCSGGRPEWHYRADVLPLLEEEWDIIIAFPPCDHLACSGNKHRAGKQKDGREQQGIDFFMKFANCKCPRVAIENPVGVMSTRWRKPDQYFNPFNFGDPYRKKTCIWVKGLPPLTLDFQDSELTEEQKGEVMVTKGGNRMPKWYGELTPNNPDRKRIRSRTFPGIARAMARQWGELL